MRSLWRKKPATERFFRHGELARGLTIQSTPSDI
jgi:hypothetical protein